MKNKFFQKVILILPVLLLMAASVISSKSYANAASSQCVHQFNGQFVESPKATCTKEGVRIQKCCKCGYVMNKTIIPKKNHQWVYGSNGKYCKVCKTKYVCAHSFNGQYDTVYAPTCTSKGKEVGKCTKCGQILNIRHPNAKGHSWKVEKKNPTTKASGYYRQVCKRCNVPDNTSVKKYEKVKFSCKKATDPAAHNHKNSLVYFNAAGVLNSTQLCCGNKVSCIPIVKDKIIGTLGMKCNYKLVVECNQSFVNLVNQKKSGSITEGRKKITLDSNSAGLLYYCDKIPLSSEKGPRTAKITIKDQFGNRLKVINIKQINNFTFNGASKQKHVDLMKKTLKKLDKAVSVSGNITPQKMKSVLRGDIISNKIVTCYIKDKGTKRKLFAARSYMDGDLSVRIDYMVANTEVPGNGEGLKMMLSVEEAYDMAIGADGSNPLLYLSEKMTTKKSSTYNPTTYKKQIGVKVAGKVLTFVTKKKIPGVLGKSIANGEKVLTRYVCKQLEKGDVTYSKNFITLENGTLLQSAGHEVWANTSCMKGTYAFKFKFISGNVQRRWAVSGDIK